MSDIRAAFTSGALCGKLCPHFKAKPARCECSESPTRLQLVYPMHWVDKASPERSEYCLGIIAKLNTNYVSPFKGAAIVTHPE